MGINTRFRILRSLNLLRPLLAVVILVSTINSGNVLADMNDIAISDLRVKTDANPVCDNCTVLPVRYIILSANNNENIERPFTMLVEARDSNGVTVFLGFLIGTLNPESSSEMGISWKVDAPGEYEIRSFAISNFTKPEILSMPSSADVTIS